MNAGKVKTFKHLGLHDTLYRNKTLGRKLLEKISNDWSALGTKTRSPYGNSFFGQSLFHIQLLKNAYGIKKRSFLKQLTFKSKDRRGVKSTNLLNLLENKLDYFLFNSGYVKTLTRAKELIETGNIKVNDELVRNSGYILNPTDKIALRSHNPSVSGETKYNVVAGFSMTTRWAFYKELFEDTMLLNSAKVLPKHAYSNNTFISEVEVMCSEKNSLKESLEQGLNVLALKDSLTIELTENLVSSKKKHFGVFLGNVSISKKYLNNTSFFLKKEKSVLENKNTRMQKYLAEIYIPGMNTESLERYITMSLVFNDLALLKPVWEDCIDQNTSDLATELVFANEVLSRDSLLESGEYSSQHFLNDSEDTTHADSEEPALEDGEFLIPQDEELDLTDELEEIRENADYYSQLEIDVVENRAPYMDSYVSTRNLYCQYIQAIFLPENSVKTENSNSICGECNCNMEDHVVAEGSISIDNDQSFSNLSSSELFLITDYYANLLFSENKSILEDTLLAADSMVQSVMLRDKKEGATFNLFPRSPEVTGENFYLDPELWELRSRSSEDFSESKTDSAEHVIKATR
jgi:ribosomal protein S4